MSVLVRTSVYGRASQTGWMAADRWQDAIVVIRNVSTGWTCKLDAQDNM